MKGQLSSLVQTSYNVASVRVTETKLKKSCPRLEEIAEFRWPQYLINKKAELVTAEKFFSLGHWSLFKALVARDLEQRYRGTFLGLGWFLFYPLLMLAMYVFVFQIVFSLRWSDPVNNPASMLPLPERFYFAFNLFAGMSVASAFLEVVGRAPRLVSDQPQFVKRVVFPLPLLAIVLSVSAWLQSLVQWFILLAVLMVSLIYVLPFTQLFEPELIKWLFIQVPLSLVIITLVLPILFAISTVLAAIGTYVKDLSQISPALSSGLMFLGPVFYPLSSVPESFRWAMFLNPITVVVDTLRSVVLQGFLPSLPTLVIYTITGTGAAIFGYWLFIRVKPGFADVV